MRLDDSLPSSRLIAALVSLMAACANLASAHENHAPLPTKGVTVRGDQILISAKGREAIGMTTAKVALANLRRTVRVNAKVELPWQQQAMITCLVPGKIEQVLVRPGETVTRGQELARVVSGELETLQSELLQAATEAGLAKRVVDRQTSLDSEGVIAGKTLLQAKATLVQKTTELEIARQKLRAVGLDEQSCQQILATGKTIGWGSITSPIDGVITPADVRVGQAIQPTDHLYHVVDPSRVWLIGDVLEGDVADLRTGQEIKAKFPAIPNKSFAGRVEHLRLKMDQQSRTQAVVVALSNRDGSLRPGMSGRAEIEVELSKDAVFCPADALIETRTGTYVLVQRGEGKFLNVAVKVGLQHEGRVEVLEGLFPGDQVVVVGNYLLASLMGNEHKARVKASTGSVVGEHGHGEVREVVVAQATIELPTDRQVFASSGITGRASRILVNPSQAVRAGQVLAEVDSLELRHLQLELLETAAKMRWTRNSLERLAALGREGNVPKQQIWQLQNNLTVLQQRTANLVRKLTILGLTEAQVERLEQLDLGQPGASEAIVATLPVRAPADGWLVGFDVIPGQVVQPQDRLFEIHDLSKVWAKGFVFERDTVKVRVGQHAHVTFSAYPGLEVAGTVVRTAPMLESSERVLPVWIEIDNPDLRLKQGMLARVAFTEKAAGVKKTARNRQNSNDSPSEQTHGPN